MKLIKYTTPAFILAEEGKRIREIKDVYKEEHIDENGNLINEHFPYYTNLIFVPSDFTEEDMNSLYIEEE